MRSIVAAVLFGLVSGSCDVCGFLGLHQLFTANITGDLVLIGADWASHRPHDELGRMLAVPVFMALIWLGRLLASRVRQAGLPARKTLLVLTLILLALFMALALTQGPFRSQDAPNTLTVGLIGVMAMGLVNVVARLWPALAQGSTAMTGNTVKLFVDLAELVVGERPHEPHLVHDSIRLALSVTAFVGGCALGALVYVWAGMWCTALPFGFGLCMLPMSPSEEDP
jgi:uncharacterized membrane protein YoaK (UPF0700 family)